MPTSIEQVYFKVLKRLVPFIMLMFFISLLDRANISYAAIQMNKDLSLGPETYGLAAGIFFVGYALFEIPSNIILAKVGARKWLGRIMISWGLVATAMAWVSGPTSLHTLRLLLGIAEAGLLPGVMFYLSRWVPSRARGMTFSMLMSTTAIAYIIGGPLSTFLMSFDDILGLRGWQFMFVVEGVPAVIVGLVALFRLPEEPRDASWLTKEESDLLGRAIDGDQTTRNTHEASTLLQGLTDRRILLCSLFAFFSVCCNFGTVFWLPQIINSFGHLSTVEVGFLSTIPYALGGIGMILWGRHSDRSGERRLHLCAGGALSSIGYGFAAVAPTSTLAFIGICVAAIGVWSTFGILWAYAGDLVSGRPAATGFAVINSVGTLGGFVGPFLIGWVRAHTNDFSFGLLVLSGFAALTALFALTLQGRLGPASKPFFRHAETQASS